MCSSPTEKIENGKALDSFFFLSVKHVFMEQSDVCQIQMGSKSPIHFSQLNA